MKNGLLPKISGVVLLMLLAAAPVFAAGSDSAPDSPQKILIFYSPGCHSCIKIKEGFIPLIEQEFKGKIEIQYLDIGEINNYKLMLGLEKQYHAENLGNKLPVIYLAGRFLSTEAAIRNNLKDVIAEALKKNRQGELPVVPAIDLFTRFKGFNLLVIFSAGLIDGINPCAFTVIVFFISFLALQGYRRRELVVIGLIFILAVFLTYLLIGLGLFGFLYRVEGFRLISRFFNLAVGALSIIFGIFALYDFFKFKKTGQTEGLVLQLPQAVKNKIHSVIGMEYRTKGKEYVAKRNMPALMFSALITGFLVSILESVCTGQTYLPTIVFILKTAHHLRAFWYLLIYNLMFILPLVIIFLLALSGVASDEFSKFLKKHLLTVKILMALLFFGLGLYLLIGRG